MGEFRCRRCGRCCRWPGIVKLAPGEAEPIARFLGLDFDEFMSRYTRISPDRQNLALTENADHSCVFLCGSAAGEYGCRIHPVKPQQCRDFPDKWNFPGWRGECPAGADKA